MPSETLEIARHHHAQGHLLEAAESYRQAIQQDSRNQNALLGLSLIARQSNQLQQALVMAKAALAANAESALAWANCGDTLLALNEPALAKSAFQQALTLDPTIPAAHFGLGHLAALKEDFEAAKIHFNQAIRQAPNSSESHFALGFTLAKLARHTEAIQNYRRALQINPQLASAWLNLGVALIADGQPQLADHAYRQALLTSQHNPEPHLATRISAHLNLGHLARSRHQFKKAQHHYQAAESIATQTATIHRETEIQLAFTSLHLDQNQIPQAWHSLRQAERSDPKDQEVLNTKGILLLAEQTQIRVPNLQHGNIVFQVGITGLIDEAIEAFTEAEAAGHKTAPSNRGNALLRQGRIEEALEAHKKAVAISPNHPGARYNLALTQLRAGNFREGWPNYEIRWQFREVHPQPRRYHQPRWQGQALPTGITLLIYSEQGLGDTLQFLRYLSEVHHRTPATPVILEVQPQLVRLLSQLANVRIHPHGQPLPSFTHHIPLLSLPALFETTLETIPANIPYLYADPALTQLHFKELSQLTGPKIGLNWAGNPHYRADHERSTSLQTLIPLLELQQFHWISLQNGPPAQQIGQLPPHLTLHNLSEHDRDLADTAALIAKLDLIITTDTAIAHLAGAMGKPLWLLLPWQSDWRWMQNIPTTPWYPQARLFRQSSAGDWPELIRRVSMELEPWLNHLPAPTQA
jgi:tetratricopeptide (TPR) repeat protein